MARRRYFRKARRSVSRFTRRAGRRSRRSSGLMGSNSIIQIDAMGYGAARPFIRNYTQSVEAMIPLGGYADNIVMGAISWAAAKYGSGIIRSAGQKGLTVENAMVGSKLSGQFAGATGNAGGIVYN